MHKSHYWNSNQNSMIANRENYLKMMMKVDENWYETGVCASALRIVGVKKTVCRKVMKVLRMQYGIRPRCFLWPPMLPKNQKNSEICTLTAPNPIKKQLYLSANRSYSNRSYLNNIDKCMKQDCEALYIVGTRVIHTYFAVFNKQSTRRSLTLFVAWFEPPAIIHAK